MNNIKSILSNRNHRVFEYPEKSWTYYQEWNRVLFLHYEVPLEVLRELVPEELNIDTFNGKAYVSIVPFTMEKIRPRFLPAVNFISNFHEINVRTYVEVDNKHGVYFLNIEAEKYLSTIVAKNLSGLPYEKATISRDGGKYVSENTKKGFYLNAEYSIGERNSVKTELEIWLTERYCLYVDDSDSVFRYDIHHEPWNLKHVNVTHLDLNYKIGGLEIKESTNLVNYSDGIKVVAWSKEKL